MKKILVPTDFSDCADAASDYAIQLAKMSKAEIHFFHLLHVTSCNTTPFFDEHVALAILDIEA